MGSVGDGVLPGPVPAWLRAIIGIVVGGTLGLVVLLGFVLAKVFLSHDRNAIALNAAKGQLVVGAVTGVLTIAIASGTIWYARLTHVLVAQAEATRGDMQDEIRLAREQLSLGRMSMRLAMRPLLADVPAGWYRLAGKASHLYLEGYGTPFVVTEPGEVLIPPATGVCAYLIVPLRNVGAGPAVVVGGRIVVGAAVAEDCTSSEIVVPPNEVTSLVFVVRRDLPPMAPIVEALLRPENVDVVVSYTNVQGGDALQTRLSLGSDPTAPQKMRVLSVGFLEGLSMEA